MRRWSDAEFNTEQMYNQIVKYISLNVSLIHFNCCSKVLSKFDTKNSYEICLFNLTLKRNLIYSDVSFFFIMSHLDKIFLDF